VTEVMTLQEVAAFLKAHPNTVYRLARAGKIPAFKLGTDWRFERRAIEAWIRLRQQGNDNAPAEREDDVLHLLYWMVGQGIALSISVAEMASLLDRSERSTRGELRRLAARGYVALGGDADRGAVALSPEGLTEARKRFGRRELPLSGHASVVRFAMRHSTR
jgi:excisionase family DNA binding protein